MIEENKYLPYICWLPKLQKKNATKARFITAAPKCSPKPLSKSVTTVFKMFIHQTDSSNNQSQYVSGINAFRTLNNQPVIKRIDSIYRRTTAVSNLSFYFSNLHANILHNKLLKVLCEHIDFSFKGPDCAQ